MRVRSFGPSILLVVLSPNLAPRLAAEPPTQVPFELRGGFAVVVHGAIRGQDHLNILVDTGAVPSVVAEHLARKLKLSGPREVISVVNQNRSLERVSLSGLRLGPLDFPTVSALDTGADNLTLYARRVGALTLGMRESGLRKDVSAAGEYEVHQVRLSNVRLGGVKRAGLLAASVNSPEATLRDFDGLLGPTALGITRVAFDFRSNTLYLEAAK